MVEKKVTFRGKTLEELQNMELKDFVKLIPARKRRSLLKGLTEQQKILLEKIKKKGQSTKPIKTHVRDMIVVPEMVGSQLLIHNGKEWSPLNVTEEMLGHYLGEFSLTRKKVGHSAPGVGATRSSAAVSKK
ncbi:MAG: 30S ribosomal protein S19 [Candidatus Woesearchaeota archaeon]